MRGRRGVVMVSAVAILALAGGSPGVSAGGTCRAEARDPKAILIEGISHVRAVHVIECAVPVGSIRVEGKLTMDGRLVASAARTCVGAVTKCQVSTSHRNPSGIQAWQGATGGAYAIGGATHPVRWVASAIVRV